MPWSSEKVGLEDERILEAAALRADLRPQDPEEVVPQPLVPQRPL